MNDFWACPKKCCLPPSLNGRSKWMPRAVALLHYSIQTVLTLSPNPTWALGSAAQLSLFLALHCIITQSSLHSLPRLCTTPLHCSIARNPLSQLFSLLSPTLQPSGWSITACTALLLSPGLQQLQSLPRLPHLCSRVQLFYCSIAEILWLCHLPPVFCGTAQSGSIKPPVFFSALSIQYQAAALLKHPPAFFDHLMLFSPYLWCYKECPPTPICPSSSARSCFAVP